MNKTILFAVLAAIGASALIGCGSSDSSTGPATAQEKKSFGGGPMPADVRKKFEADQQQQSQTLADRIAKAKADAQAGGKAGGQ